jgi:hypothetical protein
MEDERAISLPADVASPIIITESGAEEIKEFLAHEFPIVEMLAKSYKGKNTVDTSKIGVVIAALKECARKDVPTRVNMFLTCFLSNKERLVVEDDLGRMSSEEKAKLTTDKIVELLGYKTNDEFVKKKFAYLKRKSPKLIGSALQDDSFKHLINELLSLKDLISVMKGTGDTEQVEVTSQEIVDKMTQLAGE